MPAVLDTSTSRATRAGAVSAVCRAMRPPSEYPQSVKRSGLRSSTPATQPAKVIGPGTAAALPWPGRSRARGR